MNVLKNAVLLIMVFCLSVFICVLFLIMAASIPQEPVDANILDSAIQINDEGSEFYVADRSWATRMSNNSESIMLMESKAMSSNDIKSIFLNPIFSYEQNESSVENLLSYAMNEDDAIMGTYSRYWMGFRATLRLLLVKLDYYQIRRYTATLFFVLLFAAVCSVAKHINYKYAFVFALSIILVRPHVIAVSLQAFPCFCIALISMMLVPFVNKYPRLEMFFFMEIGLITMYFDFYTTPILTFGLPMIYLYMLRWNTNQNNSINTTCINSIAWICGYGFMWLSKLILTTIFTEENAFEIAFNSFLYRIQASDAVLIEHQFSALDALSSVAWAIMSDYHGRIVVSMGAICIVGLFVFRFVQRKRPGYLLLKNYHVLIISSLPIVWFITTSQPTAIHSYFQYRGIAVTFLGVFSYMYLCTNDTNIVYRDEN